MTPGNAPPLDGWHWPSGVPAPESLDQTRAGGLHVRYPRPDAALAPPLTSVLREAQRRLARRLVSEIAGVLDKAARRFMAELDDGVPRGAAYREAAANASLSAPMVREVVKEMAGSWTGSSMGRLVDADFRDARALDGFVNGAGRQLRASGHGLVVHVGAGSVPGLTIGSICRALLVKSAVLAKPGAGDVALTVRFARVLAETDPEAGAALAVQYWPGGRAAHDVWERAVLRRADQVVVHGSDAAIEAVRARAPAATGLVEHRHRMGVAVVDPAAAPDSARHAARAVALFDQRGCTSPHLFLLLADRTRSTAWCRELADHLAALDASLPPGAPEPAAQSAVQQLRGRLAMRKAASAEIGLWAAPDLGWIVVMAEMDEFEPIGNRTAWVVSAPDRAGCARALAGLSPVLQSVGLAGVPPDTEFAEVLFDSGVSRIVPLDRMPFPDVDWVHDGSRPLRDLVRWCELR